MDFSPYNPRPAGTGPDYLAMLQWAAGQLLPPFVVPTEVRPESQDVKTFEFQLAPLPKPGSLQLKPGQHVRLALPWLSVES